MNLEKELRELLRDFDVRIINEDQIVNRIINHIDAQKKLLISELKLRLLTSGNNVSRKKIKEVLEEIENDN